MNKISFLEKELNLIRDVQLRAFISACVSFAPDYFFTIPASTTGKYHPEYSLGEGGLIRHTKAAVLLAEDLLRLEQYSHLPHDEIIAALILHDSCKKGLDESESMYTVAEHPLCARDFLIDKAKILGFVSDKVDVIGNLIASHMGQWNTGYKSSVEILPKPTDEAQKFVHLCDYLASRKFLNVAL